MLSRGKNGVPGYVRQSEEDEASGVNKVKTREDALAWNEYVASHGPFAAPVYLEDGETVVDWFVIG